MKKLFLSLIVTALGALGMYAQDDLVATLNHGSELSTFSGADALAQAYEAAADGDVITLSPGTFNAVNIEKAITVRGAGMVAMETNNYVSTQLLGDMTVNVPSGTSSILTIEGVQALGSVDLYGNDMEPVRISKCRFERNVYGLGVSMSAYYCIFARKLSSDTRNGSKNTTITCFNSVIADASSDAYSSTGAVPVPLHVGKIVATNCLASGTNLPYSVFSNCIIQSDRPLPETCSAHNCLGINKSGTSSIFANIIVASNIMAEGTGETAFTPIFKTLKKLDRDPAITETFELTEEAAAKYLGDDGTQVGIYGGSSPFNANPASPQVTKFSVNSTTENGQLKVKINVE